MPLIICSGVTRKNRLEQGKDFEASCSNFKIFNEVISDFSQ